jgi:hypothetical protein
MEACHSGLDRWRIIARTLSLEKVPIIAVLEGVASAISTMGK